jgi:hypothetical protein
VRSLVRATEDPGEKRSRARDVSNGTSITKAATRSSLKDAIKRFRSLEKLLLAGEIDERLLRDLRTAVNRVRNTAWGVQQYIGQKEVGQDPETLLTILAGERIRTAYSLCQAVSSDLKKPEISFQPGSLLQLQEALRKLETDVSAALSASRSITK